MTNSLHCNNIVPNSDRRSKYDLKNFQNVFEACDICNPVSIEVFEDFKNEYQNC